MQAFSSRICSTPRFKARFAVQVCAARWSGLAANGRSNGECLRGMVWGWAVGVTERLGEDGGSRYGEAARCSCEGGARRLLRGC